MSAGAPAAAAVTPPAPAGHDPRREYLWIRARELGWLLIGTWQALSLLSEFVPIDVQSRAMRIVGKALGLVGLALVAWGFERLMRLEHRHAYRWRQATR